MHAILVWYRFVSPEQRSETVISHKVRQHKSQYETTWHNPLPHHGVSCCCRNFDWQEQRSSFMKICVILVWTETWAQKIAPMNEWMKVVFAFLFSCISWNANSGREFQFSDSDDSCFDNRMSNSSVISGENSDPDWCFKDCLWRFLFCLFVSGKTGDSFGVFAPWEWSMVWWPGPVGCPCGSFLSFWFLCVGVQRHHSWFLSLTWTITIHLAGVQYTISALIQMGHLIFPPWRFILEIRCLVVSFPLLRVCFPWVSPLHCLHCSPCHCISLDGYFWLTVRESFHAVSGCLFNIVASPQRRGQSGIQGKKQKKKNIRGIEHKLDPDRNQDLQRQQGHSWESQIGSSLWRDSSTELSRLNESCLGTRPILDVTEL